VNHQQPLIARSEWLLDPNRAHLNQGGFGTLPVAIADAAARWRRDMESDPTDLFMRRWQGLVDGVRDRVAAFLRADPSDLVFVANATAGTATVLGSLDLGAGDEVVTTDHRYPAVASQLGALAARRGVAIREAVVPLDAGTDADVVGPIVEAITARTRVVVVDQVASPTGFVFPVEQIVRAVHERGVPVLVDAAHAPGQLDVDLAAIGADFWVGNLHKWVCTPRAVAALVVAPAWQERIRPLIASHHYTDGFRAAFDWTGTLDPIPLLTVPDALSFWESLGWENVRRYQHDVATAGAAVVATALGTRVAVADRFTAAMRIVELPGALTAAESSELAGRLTTEHDVTAYLPSHAGKSHVRVCGQVFQTPADYARLADALVALLGQSPTPSAIASSTSAARAASSRFS
jgi:isopenicillin-N epimerase